MKPLPDALGSAVTAALLTALLPVASASAEVRSFHDPAHDVRDSNLTDIGRIVVQHSPASVRVRAFPPRSRPGAHSASDGVTNLWLDTDPRREGPEWGAVATWETGEVRVLHAFGDSRGFHVVGTAVCTLDSATYSTSRGSSQIVVPRRCIGRPEAVGVNLTVSDESHLFPQEFVPSQQSFTPAVRAG